MKKRLLQIKVDKKCSDTKSAIEAIIACITAPGQRKKIKQNEQAKRLLDFYGIDI